MLVKYREELTRPIDEAMEFLKRVEAQLDSIAGGAAAGSSSSARLSLAGKIDRPQVPSISAEEGTSLSATCKQQQQLRLASSSS